MSVISFSNNTFKEIVGMSTLVLGSAANYIWNTKAWDLGNSLKSATAFGFSESVAFTVLSPFISGNLEEGIKSVFKGTKLEGYHLQASVGIGVIAAKAVAILIGKNFTSQIGHPLTNNQVKNLISFNLIDFTLLGYYAYQQGFEFGFGSK